MNGTWVLIGVETDIPWPTRETEVSYCGKKIILLPETKELEPAITTYIESASMEEGITLCRKFMSALAWTEGCSIKEIDIVGSGQYPPLRIGKRTMLGTQALHFEKDYLPETDNPKALLALALYREALAVNSIPYKFLGFFKIINIVFPNGQEQKEWIGNNIKIIKSASAYKRLEELGNADIGEYLYKSGRCAIAHASSEPIVNPDAYDDLERLKKDLDLIKTLAEMIIENELHIKSAKMVWQEHLYELEGFYKYIDSEIIRKVKNGELIENKLIKLPEIAIEIKSKPGYESLSNLKVTCDGNFEGKVSLKCETQDKLMSLAIILDFKEERLYLDPQSVELYDNGSPEIIGYAIDYLEFYGDLLCNGKLEVKKSDNHEILGYKDPHIPVNINPAATRESFQQRISELKKQLEIRKNNI